METKTCSITENEIKQLIIWHGYNLNDEGKAGLAIEDMEDRIERINYLNRRLKADKKEVKAEVQPNNDQAAVGAVKASW
jgi:hypothetical protein